MPTPRPGSQFAETDTPTRNVTAYDGPGERVDGGLVLLESSYENSTGQVSLTFEASEPTAVTLVDAGGFQEGGVLHQRHFIVDPGESTYQFPVTKIDGWVGVSITTDEVVYAEPIRVDDMTSVLDPPVESDLLALAVGISLPPMILWGYDAWKSRREGEGVTRIDGP